MKIIERCSIAVLLLCLVACQNWLDVEPKTEMKSDVMFESESGFKDAIIGIYMLMGDRALYGRELTTGFMDVLGQQFSLDKTYSSYARIKDYEYDKASSIIANIWNQMYNIIANVNNIIENTEAKREVLHPTNYQIIRGEAIGLRAFLHFELLKMFGWGDLEKKPENWYKISIPYVFAYEKMTTRQSTVRELLE